ncbi:putative bifunctional diguanylate cyclase/phosphodiesterase [Geoalkalibacter sp.]|uniref:putative bifunctional diguanylate cyclase/phosphodiesterase n=1 Tax=Geoalkalibacter sp. TaxID=3041440 RepID=UPI00272E04F1|nr:EAL domain-containing protein [Geoalkalibacter sp.]
MRKPFSLSRDIFRGLIPASWSMALKISCGYLALGLLWILLSDRLLAALVADPHTLTRLQTFKGLIFILITFVLLFILLWHQFNRLRRAEEQIALVAQGVSSSVGDAFFTSLVAYLAQVLETDCALVATIDENEANQVQTIALWRDGAIRDNIGYSLEGSPCGALRGKEICWCPKNVRSKQKPGHPLCQMDVDSCLAMGLRDAEQRLIGVIMVLSRGPMEQRRTAESLLRIFATRAAAELERKAAERKIAHMAFFDPLTDLPNQQRFREEFETALMHARRRQASLALVYFDFDRFKTIVRTLGHLYGQWVLRQTATKLKENLRPGEIFAHLGGDEFGLVLPDVASTADVRGAIERVLNPLKAPMNIVGHELYVTASVGVALFPHDGEDAETLLRHADVAMSRAKAMGRNNVQFYTPEMSRRSFQALVLENRLHRAMERNEFMLLYQPQLDLAGGTLSGMEALICWKQEGRSTFSPSEFIPLAEETGLIDPLGEWILFTACRQNRDWQKAGLPPQRVAVNVSARQFFQRDIAALVARVLKETGLDPEWLALEITESILFQDIAETTVTLEKLRDLGVHLVIDDFGTGYSSLTYLKNFPMGTLKIDQSFIAGIPGEQGACTITTAVIAMAHHLRMTVVAEGVESEDQKKFLERAGCEKIQGFLYSAPLEPGDFARLLERNSAA